MEAREVLRAVLQAMSDFHEADAEASASASESEASAPAEASAETPAPAYYSWTRETTQSFLAYTALCARLAFSPTAADLAHYALVVAANDAKAPAPTPAATTPLADVPVCSVADDQGTVLALRAAYGEIVTLALAHRAATDPAAAFWNRAWYYNATDSMLTCNRAFKLDLPESDYRRALPAFASPAIARIAATLAALPDVLPGPDQLDVVADDVLEHAPTAATLDFQPPPGRARLVAAAKQSLAASTPFTARALNAAPFTTRTVQPALRYLPTPVPINRYTRQAPPNAPYGLQPGPGHGVMAGFVPHLASDPRARAAPRPAATDASPAIRQVLLALDTRVAQLERLAREPARNHRN